MGQIFSDLSYNNKTLKPIGQPLEEMRALVKEKNDNYNYVIDTQNKTKTALNNIPSTGKDKHYVEKAIKDFDEKFTNLGENLEDKVIDTKKLVNDVANNYGLTEVQRVAKEQAEYEAGLKKRFESDDISENAYHRAIAYSRDNYKGVSRDKKTGLFSGSYNGREVSNYIDISKEISDILKGFKANTTPLQWEGQSIVPDPKGSGYMLSGSQKSVSARDLTNAARAYVNSNAKIQAQLNEDIFYEINSKGEIKTEDLKSLILQDRDNALGIKSKKDLNNLDKILEEKGIDNKSAYSILRKDQMIREASYAGIERESFVDTDLKYTKPLEINTDESGSGNDVEKKGLRIASRLLTQQKISPKDFTDIKEGKKASKLGLEAAKIELDKITGDSDFANGKRKQIKEQITAYNRRIEQFEISENNIKNFITRKVKNNVPIKQYYETYRNNIIKKRAEEFNNYKKKYTSNGAIPSDAIFGGDENILLSVSEFNAKVHNLLDEKYKTKSYKEYENEVIYKYTQDDTSNLPLNNAASDFDNSTRFVSTKINEKLGGKLKDTYVTQDIFAIKTDNLSKTTNIPFKAHMNLMQSELKDTPENFEMNNTRLVDIAKKEFDVKPEDIDWNKTKLYLTVESANGKPVYAVDIYEYNDSDKRTTSTKKGRTTVNYTGDSSGGVDVLQQTTNEMLKQYSSDYIKGALSGQDLEMFRKLSKANFNNSFGGRELDALNIYTGDVNVPIKWQIKEGYDPINIIPKYKDSNKEYGEYDFELEDKEGNAYGTYKGNVGFWNKAKLMDGSPNTSIYAFSGVDELKEVIGGVVVGSKFKN